MTRFVVALFLLCSITPAWPAADIDLKGAGAKGDGSDDTAVVQAWLASTDSKSLDGDTRIRLSCPPGRYGINRTLLYALPGFATIEGVAHGCVFFWTGEVGIPAPGMPTVAVQGLPGSTEWQYQVTARLANGHETHAGPSVKIRNGAPALSMVRFNRLSNYTVPGATDYRIWRYLAGGTPRTTGLIGTTSSAIFDDTGLPGDGSPIPRENNTGGPMLRIKSANTAHLTLSNLRLDCNGRAQTAVSFSGVTRNLEQTWGYKVEYLTAVNCRGPHILVGELGASGDAVFTRPVITGLGSPGSNGIIGRAGANNKGVQIQAPYITATDVAIGVEAGAESEGQDYWLHGLYIFGGSITQTLSAIVQVRGGGEPIALRDLAAEVNPGAQLWNTLGTQTPSGSSVILENNRFTVAGNPALPLATFGGATNVSLKNNYFHGDPPADRKIRVGSGLAEWNGRDRMKITSEGNVFVSNTPLDMQSNPGCPCDVPITSVNDRFRNASTKGVPLALR